MALQARVRKRIAGFGESLAVRIFKAPQGCIGRFGSLLRGLPAPYTIAACRVLLKISITVFQGDTWHFAGKFGDPLVWVYC